MALTMMNIFHAGLCDFRLGGFNPGTFGTVLTSHASGHSRSLMRLSWSPSDSPSAAQSSSLSFGLSKSPFQMSQSSVSEMPSGAQSSSFSTGWRLILLIQWTFNILSRAPRRSFADIGGGNGDHSVSSNAAAASWWKSDKDELMISSVSKNYPPAVICFLWAQDSFWVACRYWLPCHISNKSWTLAILCNVLSSVMFFISESFSGFIVSNSGSAKAKIQSLARANCLMMTLSRRVSQLVFDCLQPMTSQPRDKLASYPTPCGMRETMSHAIIELSAYIECVSSCWHHQSVMSSIQNVLLISIGSEW